jgi:integrase/recombinase XerD
MASVKIVHFKSKKYSDGTSPILLRVIIDRVVKYYKLGDTLKCKYYLKINGNPDPRYKWNEDNGTFNSNFPNSKTANRNLHKRLAEAEGILIDLENEDDNFCHEDFRDQFIKKEKRVFLLAYMDYLIERLRSTSKIGNAMVYESCRNIFKEFLKEDILFTSITPKLLNQFIESCQKRGLKKNSISYYLRTLRAVCNTARKEEGLKYYPFENFDRWKELKDTTDKRALSKEDMLRIIRFEAPEESAQFHAIKYFTFMYITYGLNFADLAKLTNKNIKKVDGLTLIRYNRSKGGKLYEIPLDETGIAILKYYKKQNPESAYIFPILNEEIHITPEQIKTRIKTALKKTNSDLETIGEELEIDHKITTYVARHTFATVLYKNGENPGMISEMLGHSNLQTTLTYLKSFDHSAKLNAGKKLL